jgi:poly(3-hydroxybutyrate) depolymerase
MRSRFLATCLIAILVFFGCTKSSKSLTSTAIIENIEYSITATQTLSVMPNQQSTQAKLISITVTDNETQTAENRQFVVHYQQINDSVEFNTIVFDIHGSGPTSNSKVYTSLINQYSDKASNSSIIFVYPLGMFVEQSNGTSTLAWNLGAGSDSQKESQANDLLFIQAIYQYLQNEFEHSDRLALTKVIGIGSSQGSAFLLNRLATQLDIFTGVCGKVSQLFEANDAGYIDLNTVSNRYKVLYFYGYNDPIIPYEGGDSEVGHSFLSVADSLVKWATRNQINNNLTTQYYSSDESQSGAFTVNSDPTDIFYAYNDANYPVHAYQHNVKHKTPQTINGKPVTEIIWDFFEI